MWLVFMETSCFIDFFDCQTDYTCYLFCVKGKKQEVGFVYKLPCSVHVLSLRDLFIIPFLTVQKGKNAKKADI